MSPTLATPTAPRRPPLACPPGPAAPAVPQNRLGFFLFLLVNAALYLRPAEVVPDLRGLEIYQYLILGCLAVSFPAFLRVLSPAFLDRRPLTLCVIAFLPAVLLSLLSHVYIAHSAEYGWRFFKVLLYFLLLVALVDSPARLRTLLTWLAVFAAVMTFLTILDWYGYIELPKMPPPGWKEGDKLPEDDPLTKRMVGSGIFQDPNDLCVLIVVGIILTLYRLSDRRAGPGRALWLVALTVLLYGFVLTRSRGGLMALAAGGGVMVGLRYGWRRAVLVGVLAVPLLPLLGSRQTDISANVNTGQERIQLWSEALRLFRSSPLFGVGMEHFRDDVSHVAHNSYLHAFAELGLFGGTLFFGAFYLALRGLVGLGMPAATRPGAQPVPRKILDPDLAAMHPYLTGAVVGYATGIMMLTLCYEIPTYTVLGAAAVFLPMAVSRPPAETPRFDSGLMLRLLGMSVCFLIGMYVFVRVFFRA